MNGTCRITLACLVCVGLVSALSCGTEPQTAVIYTDPALPQVQFAAGDIESALARQGYAVIHAAIDQFTVNESPDAFRIVLAEKSDPSTARQLAEATESRAPDPVPQGYAIRLSDSPRTVWVIGGDSRGVMYGGLAVAEALAYGEDIAATDHAPFIDGRGLKFNIPLDSRTPGFDDTGDAAQQNIPTVWDFSFWEAYLDGMARNRYNMLSLWNPHPFPHLVKLADYPDAALDNVMRTTLPLTYEAHAWGDPGSVTRDILDNLEVVKQITIDEKIAFWQKVMRHAKDRGIDVYFITWNVLMNSVSEPGRQDVTYIESTKPGKHRITDDQDNPTTIAYVRASTRVLLETYPDLAGIGVTAGENMRPRDDEYDQIKWLWRAYGEGIMDFKRDDETGREVKFIHRVWWGGLDTIMEDFAANYPDPLTIGFKYARAHLYSSTKPPFADALLPEMEKYGVNCWWNLRNDDIFVLRWGDPGYVREFLANLPPREYTAGYHMGSDGYVWGREFISHDPQTPRQLEMDKHWLKFMLWGQLGYDNRLTDDHFARIAAARMPETAGTPFLEAWITASKIVPLVNRFHWRDWDFMWAAEGCMDQERGFQTVEDFIESTPMEGSGILSIPAFIEQEQGDEEFTGITPLEVADELDRLGSRVRELHTEIRRACPQPSRELRYTLADISAFGYLGQYYAEKIRGAVALHRFRQNGDESQRDEAVGHLEAAIGHWGGYANVMYALYDTQMLARTRRLDLMALYQDVSADISIARGGLDIDRLFEVK